MYKRQALRELKALAESIKRMYADYVNDFVKEVS